MVPLPKFQLWHEGSIIAHDLTQGQALAKLPLSVLKDSSISRTDTTITYNHPLLGYYQLVRLFASGAERLAARETRSMQNMCQGKLSIV